MQMDWDYVIVTASNDRQAQAYEMQLRLRQRLGLLPGHRHVLVVPDTGGRRIGSGGSTLLCLMEVLSRELRERETYIGNPSLWRQTLGGLRILIVHAGGDSRRLPAYSPCGKIFVPVPGESDSCLPVTLLDRQLPTYLDLPAAESGDGQIVITSGDVLLRFDPRQVTFRGDGITGLACYASPEQASHHGVFCGGDHGRVRRFLQKPLPDQQQAAGAIDALGRTALDIGVMHLTADTAVRFLELFGTQVSETQRFAMTGELGEAVYTCGLDFYREVCCAMGEAATQADYIDAVRRAGSAWRPERLGMLFDAVSQVPLYVHVLPSCEFLHFGTSRQVIDSGNYLVQQENKYPSSNTVLCVNTQVGPAGKLAGSQGWVEGCRILGPVTLEGQNLLVGVDVEEPLALPAGACVDVIAGRTLAGREVWFARLYGMRDTFHGEVPFDAAVFCGMPLSEWLDAVKGDPEDLWPAGAESRSLWHAKLFPALPQAGDYRRWLWMFDPRRANDEQRKAWKTADRYSLAQMAELAGIEAFHERRQRIYVERMMGRLGGLFAQESGFSAGELAEALRTADDPKQVLGAVITEARRAQENSRTSAAESLMFARIMHTLGSALLLVRTTKGEDGQAADTLVGRLPPDDRRWLESLALPSDRVDDFASRARTLAFESLGRAIISSDSAEPACPRAKVRSDEIIWGRAPARFDTGGGWTDTPPYSLEHGGRVVNTAVNLNGQPPIQAYLRIIDKPVVRIGSIDLGTRIEIDRLEELLDYRRPDSEYGLAKAALALSGFSPEAAPWPGGIELERMLELFGGGIELTTLAAVPKGSGLGTSSIMGAVLLAVIARARGRQYTQRELFNAVLRLEQLLTTGGGWQDQIGGAVGGSKIITTRPGLIPDAHIEYLVPDVIDPSANGGRTLLYYTGITRLAKGILGQVVGHYLDRDRATVATLRQIHALAPRVAEAMSRKDLRAFGQLVATAWELNKQLDPGSTNDRVEGLMARTKPHVHGAKLLGAGGGGFLLMVCRSREDADRIRRMLDLEPPNDRARFFDYQVNHEGLIVTAC